MERYAYIHEETDSFFFLAVFHYLLVKYKTIHVTISFISQFKYSFVHTHLACRLIFFDPYGNFRNVFHKMFSGRNGQARHINKTCVVFTCTDQKYFSQTVFRSIVSELTNSSLYLIHPTDTIKY